MQFITDKMRKEMCEEINNSPMLIIAAMKFFTGKYKKINFELFLIDYYNSMMVKKNMHTLDDNDINFLELVNNNKVEDLMYLINNVNFVAGAFTAMVNFYSLTTLDRHQIIRIADYEKEENDLTKRSLYKLNYLSTYLPNEINDLTNYYKEYINKNGNELFNHDSARDIIFNHILEMRGQNYDDYIKILAHAIPVYYKWGKFTISKHKKEVDTTSKLFIKRIEWLKLDDLFQLTMYDNEFLIDIITQYLYFETLPKDITNEVEAYSDKKLSKRMKRKLDNNKKTTSN